MKAVSKTAFYCCGVRMQDAESPNPIINDQFARRLMGEAGLTYWEEFKQFKKPNAGNTARHYIIDRQVEQLLSQNPSLKVFLIGAGLDSRAFRFKGGNWFEIDAPGIMEYKNGRLPIEECPNPLTRMTIDFATEKLSDLLLPYKTDEQVLIIVEGVILYLSNEQLDHMLKAVQYSFPNTILLCDLMKKDFFHVFSRKIHKTLVESGTSFQDINNRPNRLFLENGFEQTFIQSTAKTSVEMGLVKLPKLLTHHLLGNFMMGYSVYQFEYQG